MNNMELPLYIGGREYRAVLQDGFFSDRKLTTALHDHSMPEVHLQIAGSSSYRVGEEIITLLPDTLLLIPAGSFHCAVNPRDDERRIAFQVPLGACEKRSAVLPAGTSERVWLLARESLESKCGNRLSACLSYLCAQLLCDGSDCKLLPAKNRELVIRDFFSRRYAEDVTVGSLAAELSLSVKQTERLVKSLYGKTFGQKLTSRRIEVASQLMSMGQLSLSELARAVGFKSYSGFWKAFRKKE